MDGPPPGHTGGFGEPSCHRCHFDRPVNPDGGELSLRGLPESYRPGMVYQLEVRAAGRTLRRGGFQLSVRCASGERQGEQAGVLEAPGDRAEVVEGEGEKYRGTAGVQYARHAEVGTKPDSSGEATWSVRWRAPSVAADADDGDGPACGRVVVHAAGNVGNGDASEFGDRIYLETVQVPRAEP